MVRRIRTRPGCRAVIMSFSFAALLFAVATPSSHRRHTVVTRSRRYRRDQTWLLDPVQCQSSTAVLFAVRLWSTSKHSPDRAPRIVPSVCTVHCWLVPPLQSHICTRAPAAASSGASRHLPSERRVPSVWLHLWLAPEPQSQITRPVPFVVALAGTSRHRPDAALTSVLSVGCGVTPPPGVTL